MLNGEFAKWIQMVSWIYHGHFGQLQQVCIAFRKSSFPFVPLILHEGSALSVNRGNASTLPAQFEQDFRTSCHDQCGCTTSKACKKDLSCAGSCSSALLRMKVKQEQSLHGQVQQE